MTTIFQTSDELRRTATRQLNQENRGDLGQFLTPAAVADFMASLFERFPRAATVLDPGAGTGALTEAFATRFLAQAPNDAELNMVAFEVDPTLTVYLEERLNQICAVGSDAGKTLRCEVVPGDFVRDGSFEAAFGRARFTHAVLNPPYKKIGSKSEHRLLLRRCGVEVVNLYTAFLALAVELTIPGGEIVAIIPRSFCNGAYFRPFRAWLLKRVSLTHIHVFDSRKETFSEDAVLQENIIVRLVRGEGQGDVEISRSRGPAFDDLVQHRLQFSDVVNPEDPEQFIHVPTISTPRNGALFVNSLAALGLHVSTGPVVDFRLKEWLSDTAREDDVPLLYAHHFLGGRLTWPKKHRKPNAIERNSKTQKWLLPRGWYTVTKRFSSKEERRRLVAYVLNPSELPHEFLGFENHLNVIHSDKQGIDPRLAMGLAVFLNSTLVDQHFRTFSGHTQVNATDLRTMRFPTREILERLGDWFAQNSTAGQAEIDAVIHKYHAD